MQKQILFIPIFLLIFLLSNSAFAEEDVMQSFAIFEFSNLSNDTDYNFLTQALPDSIATALNRTGAFMIVARDELTKELRSLGITDYETLSVDLILLISENVKADVAIKGNFVILDDIIKIHIEVYDVNSNMVRIILEERGDLKQDIFDIVDAITQELADRILEEFNPVLWQEILAQRESEHQKELQSLQSESIAADNLRYPYKTYGYISGGIGIGFIIVGFGFLGGAFIEYNHADDLYAEYLSINTSLTDVNAKFVEYQDALDLSGIYQGLSYGFWGLGIAGLTTGLILYFWEVDPQITLFQQQCEWHFIASPMPQGGVIGTAIRF